MKNLLFILALALLLNSCDDILGTDDEPDDNNNNSQILDEEVIQETAKSDFEGDDITLKFNDGASFKVPGSANANNEYKEIKILQITEERYFNTQNNVIFDFSENSSNYYVEFEYELPKGLVTDDIAAILYDPTGSEQQLIAAELDFDYNTETGKVMIQFYMFSGNGASGKIDKVQNDDKYNRLVLSWSDRFRLSEYPETKIIKMPYYEQPHGSCWATCATMYSRAYSSNKDHKEEIRIIDFIKLKGDDDLNTGIGMWDFKRNLTKWINNKTNLKTEVSTFVSSSNMLEEIIKKLDENKPMIFNLDSPSNPKGAHAVMILGYRRDLVSASKVSMELLIHNPTGSNINDVMYKWVDWEWFLEAKSYTEAFQILYADIAVPDDRPLQTVGMPINKFLGELGFKVVASKGTSFNIGLSYDKDEKHYYKWTFPNTEKCDAMPDTTESMILKLPIYNADDKAANVGMNLRIYNNDNGELVYENSDFTSLSVGENKTDIELPISEFANFMTDETEFRAELEIRNSSGRYLDGYDLYFILSPKITKTISFNIYPLDVTTETNTSSNSSTSTAEGGFGAFKVVVSGKDKY
jgi:hypothetical protein